MDFSIFQYVSGADRIANTNPMSLGHLFYLWTTGPTFVKALRFYRQTTGIFGKIDGAIYDDGTGVAIAGTKVTVTLAQGSGPTGWITLTLPAPVRLAQSNAGYTVAFHFPGGAGNGFPQRAAMANPPSDPTAAYWSLGAGAYGWKHGMVRMPPHPFNAQGLPSQPHQGRYLASAALSYPNVATDLDFGLDVIMTDTDPNATSAAAQTGPTYTLLGDAIPPAGVTAVAGPAVAGLEFTALQDTWATHLRVYRHQSNRPHVPPAGFRNNNPTPIVGASMHAQYNLSAPGVAITDQDSGVAFDTIEGALYTVDSSGSGTLVPGASLTFPQDTLTIPGFGKGIVIDGATGWWQGYLKQPLKLTAATRYRVVVAWKNGRPSLPGYFTSSGSGATAQSIGPLMLHSTATATGGAAASVKTGTSTMQFPTTADTAHPLIDVAVTTENPNDPREPENAVRVFGTVFPANQTFTIGIGARTVGTEFTATSAVTAYGLRYLVYQGIAASSARLYAVSWDGTGTPTGTPVAGSEVSFPSSPGADGWVFAPFKAPIRLAAGQRYKMAVRFTNGYAVTPGYFNVNSDGENGVVTGPLTMPPPSGAAGGIQGSYTLTDGFPDQTFNGANPWVDLTVAAGGSTAAGPAGSTGSEPSGAIRLFDVAAPTDTVLVSTANSRVVGLEFQVAKVATAWGYRFFRATTTITGAVQVRLYSVQADDTATEVVGADTTFALGSGTGWVFASLRAPVVLTPGRRYKMVFFFPSGFPYTPNYFVAGAPAAVSDIINNTSGVGLRAFSLANATRAAQPTAMVGGTVSDAVVYPTAPATDNPWIDITVTDGVGAGAVTTGEEPAGVMRQWGIADPAPGNITQAFGPSVVGHQFTLSTNSSVYGLRMWRPDLRQQTTVGRIYRVDTATTVSGTTVTFPPSTNRGWVYAPLAAAVTLQSGVAYRVVLAHPVLGPSTVNALTAAVNAGVLTTASSWRVDPQPTTATMAMPTTHDSANFWVDVSVLPGGGVPEDTLTLFASTPDATVATRTDGARTVGTTFAGQLDVADTLGNFWVKAIRFYRPSLSVTGIITARIYEVTIDHRTSPVPFTDVILNLAGNNTTGWITVELAAPVQLSTYPWYRVAVFFPSGFPYTPNYFNTGPGGQARYGPNGIVFTPPYNYAGGDAAQGAWMTGASLAYPWRGNQYRGGFATGEEYGANYWVDVVATTSRPDAAPPPNPRFPVSYSQWGQISSDTNLVGNQQQYTQIAFAAYAIPGSAGLEFTVDAPCYLHGYRVPRVDASQQNFAPSARLYTITGPNTGRPVANSDASFAASDFSATGADLTALASSTGRPVTGSDVTFVYSSGYWQSAHLNPAIPLVPGQKYKIVVFFPDAVPVGRLYSDTADIVRGPLRVPGNNHATGATSTFAQSFSLTYPSDPSPLLGSVGIPVIDLYVSTSNPQAPTPDVRSIFDRRRPAQINYQPWGPQQNYDGTLSSGWTAGMEFYVTTDTCYFKGYRFWKAPYPVVTQVTKFQLYQVTGFDIGANGAGYFAPADADIGVTKGVPVAGTAVTQGLYTSDQNQPEAYSEGWVTLSINTPVFLQPNTRYRIAVFYPYVGVSSSLPGKSAASRPMTEFFWKEGPGGNGLVDGPLIAPGRDGSFGVQQAPWDARGTIDPGPGYPADISFPASSVRSNAAHYWIDAEVYDSAPRAVDGGVVSVIVPNAAQDPRRTGVDSEGLVSGYLAVHAEVVSDRFVYTDPHAPPLNVEAVGIGSRDIVMVNPDVRPSGSGTKAVNGGIVAHEVPVVPRQAQRRPKGVGDVVRVEVSPAASAHETIEWRPMPREPELFAPTGGTSTIRFIAQEILTRRWAHWDLPLNNPTITWNLSGPFQLQGSLNPSYIDLIDLGIDEWSTFIHVEIDGVIWGTGIMMPWTAAGEELSIEAYGISSYAQGMPYIDNWVYTAGIPDVMDVVREMWRHIQSFDNGNLGLQLPAGVLGLPVFGTPVFDDQTGELLGWKYTQLTWTDFTDIGQYIDNLAKSMPFDYVEVDAWNAGHTDVLHGIKFGYPRVGDKRPELRFSEGENVLQAIAVSEPDDAYASDIVLKGAGQGPTEIYSWVGDYIWLRLRRVAIITDPQVQSQPAADGIAIAELIRRLALRGVASIVVDAFHPHAPFGSYRVGDDILVDGMIPWIGEILLWHRIVAIALQPETGLATLTLQRSEAFRYGRPHPLTGNL